MSLLNIGEAVINYELNGKGEPVLFLHGGTGDSRSYWSNQIPEFAKDFLVITIDHRGYGESRGTPGIERLANDVSKVLDYLQIERTHIVGLSLGGIVGQQFALDYPHRVRRLVLADTLPGVLTERLRRFIDDVLIGTVKTAGMKHAYELNLIFAFSERFLVENRQQFELEKEAWEKISPEPFIQTLEMVKKWNIVDRLSEIKAPTLVIWGSDDIETPRFYAEMLAEKIPNAILTVIEGAGHKSCSDRPDVFNKLVRTFLLPS